MILLTYIYDFCFGCNTAHCTHPWKLTQVDCDQVATWILFVVKMRDEEDFHRHTKIFAGTKHYGNILGLPIAGCRHNFE